MKHFRVTVTTTIEYEVCVDEGIYNEDRQKEWENVFWDLPIAETPAESFACGLAEQSARYGVNTFIYGFGLCVQNEDEEYKQRKQNIDCTTGLYILKSADDVELKSEEIKN